MTYRAGEDDTPDERPGTSALVRIFVAAMLAGAGSGSALLWRAYGTPSFTTAAATAAPVADKPVELLDLQALQQQVAGSMQSTEKLLTAQQAEIKQLADQASVLSRKLDLLQRPVISAQAAVPPPSPKPPAPAPRKKPAAPQPAGAVSTGGTALPPPIPLTR